MRTSDLMFMAVGIGASLGVLLGLAVLGATLLGWLPIYY